MSDIDRSIKEAIQHANEPILVQVPRWMVDDVAALCEVRSRRLESEANRSGVGIRASKHGLAYEWASLATSLRDQQKAQS